MPKNENSLMWFWKQAFGSDELTAYTAEYTWESNQMAHAMMGFAIAAVWLRLAIGRWARHRQFLDENGGATSFPKPKPTIFQRAWRSLDVSTVVLFALIPLKELVDILFDQTAFRDSAVPPNRWPLLFDSITDITFWWTGMFLAAAVIGGWWTVVKIPRFVTALSRREKVIRTAIPIAGLILCVAFWYLYAAPQWLYQKRTFDQSDMPFNYTRLAVLSGEKPEDRYFATDSKVKWAQLRTFRESVSDAKEKPPQAHYVIIGGTPKERSRLAVSMGSEYAFKLRPHDTAQTPIEFTRVKYVSAPAALERPDVFIEMALGDVIECVIIDDLDSVMQLTETSPSGSAKVLENLKLPEKKRNAKLDPGLARKLKLPDTFPQLKPVERQQYQQPGFSLDGESMPSVGDSARAAKFIVLGFEVQTRGISTIWVLSGDRKLPKWPSNRARWLKEIAGLVANGDEAALRIIELAEPTVAPNDPK